MDDLPVGVIDNGVLSYIQPDHLGTPRNIVDPNTNVTIWDWPIVDNPFGELAPNQDPDGDSTDFVFNLRFPGQYFDAETGLHYNYFRDYEPGTGRYVESDPIGLDGGMNTFVYVSNDPMGSTDPDGLHPLIMRICIRFPLACSAMAACRSNPAKCVQLLCKASSELSRYKIHCNIPGCREAENPWAREFKAVSACTCYVNRGIRKIFLQDR